MSIIDDFETLISDHMDKQPYSIKCSNCGADLDFVSNLDSDYDLLIEVYPCDCFKEED